MRTLKRKYLQFNDLVFDSYSVDTDYSVAFRNTVTPYTYVNGSLPTLVSGTQLVDAQTVPLTLSLSAGTVPCDQWVYFKDYVLDNITRPGRLWAVEGARVLWAYAYVSDYSEVYDNDTGVFEIAVTFVVYEGFWHISDKRKTFLYPYNPCHFNIDNKYQQARGDCCCGGCPTIDSLNKCVRCLNDCDNDMIESLCGSDEEMFSGLYEDCTPKYRLSYDCELALKKWGEDKLRGYAICKEKVCEGNLAGRFYSDTILDTETWTLTLVGKFHNPYIELNDNAFIIKGDYDGVLTLYSTGDMTFSNGDECCEARPLEQTLWELPYGSTFSMKIKHGWNTIYVETNDCCSAACVYYTVDAITV